MRLHIIRHADPDYPNDTITAAGHLEAAALAERWKTTGLDRIFTSPVNRARHTARYTADALGLTVSVENWTAELGLLHLKEGLHRGRMAWDVPGEVLRADVKRARKGNPFAAPPLDVAVFQKELERVGRDSDAFLERLGYRREGGRYRILRSHPERVAVFCHAGLGITWLAHLLELPPTLMWSGFWLCPSSVTTVLLEEQSLEWAVPRALCVGDSSHLYQAGLPVQPAGLKGNLE